jgi:muramoyltetrapeptide carboxypeptidase
MAIKPPRLSFGDTIGIIAPASAPPDPKAIDQSIAVLERLGFRPRLARNVRKRWGFLAGSDRDRAADLMQMFTDRKVNAVICVRGGYGAARVLPLLDYEAIRRNPKILIGYSDITSLHCAFLVKSNLVSFHGPMLNSDFIKDNFPDFTLNGFLRTLMEPTHAGSLLNTSSSSSFSFSSSISPPAKRRALNPHKQATRRAPVARPATCVRSGVATGPLLGGNLSILCTTLGTPYQPSFKNKILFFEDLAEIPYRFDRMLTHLLNAGVLQQVAGIAIGINANCRDPNAKKTKEYRQTMDDVIKERLLPLKIPIVSGLPFGHIPLNATLPIGIKAKLDADAADLQIIESAVL